VNCNEVRPLLVEFAYDGCTPDDRAQLDAHLALCVDCRRDLEAFRDVRRRLDETPAPIARVDVAAVYRAAADANARRLRRWRRFAGAGCVAAAVLLVVLLSRLEFHVDQHQLIVRWNTPTTVAPGQVTPEREEPKQVRGADPRETEALHALVQTLLADVRMRDELHAEDLMHLRSQLDELRRQSDGRFAALERDFSALYTAHFSSPRGVNP
jgi:hypothetical protein